MKDFEDFLKISDIFENFSCGWGNYLVIPNYQPL